MSRFGPEVDRCLRLMMTNKTHLSERGLYICQKRMLMVNKGSNDICHDTDLGANMYRRPWRTFESLKPDCPGQSQASVKPNSKASWI